MADIYDTIIVGGGLAGFAVALLIVETYPSQKVLLLEKKSRVGGRIKTIRTRQDEQDIYYDVGAVRVPVYHQRVKQWMKKLGCTPVRIPWEGRPSNAREWETYLKWLTIHVNRVELELNSMETILTKYPPPEPLQWHYENHLRQKNAADFIAEFKNYTAPTYYTVKGGLETIIDKLRERLEKYPFFVYQTNVEIHQIDYSNRRFTVSPNRYHARNLFLCCPSESIQSFRGITESRSFLWNTVTHMNPYLRVFGKVRDRVRVRDRDRNSGFPREKQWMGDVLNVCIPTQSSSSIYQLSYSDGNKARYLLTQILQYKMESILSSEFQKQGHDHLEIEWIDYHYWKHGTHSWIPGCPSRLYYKEILQPISPSVPLYVCGESFSHHQGWIEGVFETVEEAWNRFCDPDLFVDPTMSLPLIAVEELRRGHAPWVLFDGYVIDIGSYMDIHPGGKQAIQAFIGKDISSVFRRIGHSALAYSVIRSFIVAKILL